MFGDSCQDKFCSIAFLRRSSFVTNEAKIALVKARVAPMKTVLIPKFEFQAALLDSADADLKSKNFKKQKSKDHTRGQIALLYCSG